MAWKDNLETVFTITTGEGSVYTPLWSPTSKALEWNVSEFDFIGQSGTLIVKRARKGRKIPLDFSFQGNNHLDIAEAFEVSANDSRPWVILHPYYGSLTVQVPSINIDHSSYGISKITCTAVETITEDSPKTTVSADSKIASDKTALDESFITAFDVTPDAKDINNLSANNNKIYAEGSKSVKTKTEAESYFNAFNTANSAITNATGEPLQAMRTTQSVINAPALFESSVKSRLDLLTSQFNKLRSTASGITTRNGKKIYENQGGAIISAMALASSRPIDGDYTNATSVIAAVDPIIANYNNYISDLDALQTDNGGNTNSFIPDANALIALNSLINFTVSNLFSIALKAKQERSIVLDKDSNWVLLTHRLYGIDKSDKNIDELMNNNEVGLSEMLQVKKGRKVVYYL
jgi:hypothetical protein